MDSSIFPEDERVVPSLPGLPLVAARRYSVRPFALAAIGFAHEDHASDRPEARTETLAKAKRVVPEQSADSGAGNEVG